MKKIFALTLLAALTLIVSVPLASADSLTVNGSGSGSGLLVNSTYTVNLTQITATHYTATYTINFSGFNNTAHGGIYLKDISFHVAGQDWVLPPTIPGSTMTASPAGWGTTAIFDTGSNSNGCSGGGNGHVCTVSAANGGLGIAALNTGSFVFTFDLYGPANQSILPTWGIKAAYDYLDTKNDTNPNNDKITNYDQLSLEGTPTHPNPDNPVPEPSSLLLLGSGALGMTGLVRRKLAR